MKSGEYEKYMGYINRDVDGNLVLKMCKDGGCSVLRPNDQKHYDRLLKRYKNRGI